MDSQRAVLTLAALAAGCLLYYVASTRPGASTKSKPSTPRSETAQQAPPSSKTSPVVAARPKSAQSQPKSAPKESAKKVEAKPKASTSEEKKEKPKKELFERPHQAVDGQNYRFEAASPDMRAELIDLAVKANDTYGTRTADDETARRVFDVAPERHLSNGGILEVLKHRDEIVGFIAVAMRDVNEEGMERRVVELSHLTVKAGFQRSGYGTRLWHRVLEHGMRHKWRKIEWSSDPGAEQFYTKMGATRVSACENILAPTTELPSFEYNFS